MQRRACSSGGYTLRGCDAALNHSSFLQNYMNEANEVEEMPAYAMRKRTLKSGRKKKEERSGADPKGPFRCHLVVPVVAQ